jgi:lipopolysaccharide/colanic/teichoic acid biosynthesis glycosyltransferase
MKNWKIAILALGDILASYLSLLLMILISFGSLKGSTLLTHIGPFTLLFLVWIVVFYIFDQYDPIKARPYIHNFKRFGYALFTSFVFGIIIFYSGIFSIAPKLNLLLVFIFFVILVFLWRKIYFKLLKNRFFEKVIFLDSNTHTEELKQIIKTNPQLGYKLIDSVDKADIVISKSPFTTGKKLLSLSRAYENITSRVAVDIAETTLPYQIETNQDNLSAIVLKRFFDIIFSASILTATIWIWPFVILGIKLIDNGPIFYTQKRVGQYNKTFDFIKFRSMKVNSEKDGAVWAEKEDPRVTKFGKFLRKSHLDEIPQMLNILKGEMSIIGPRPERPEFTINLGKEITLYNLRHIIKPGFTGWAQVKYRYARTVAESKKKFEYDLYYIKNRDFVLDLGILLKTIQIFVTH